MAFSLDILITRHPPNSSPPQWWCSFMNVFAMFWGWLSFVGSLWGPKLLQNGRTRIPGGLYVLWILSDKVWVVAFHRQSVLNKFVHVGVQWLLHQCFLLIWVNCPLSAIPGTWLHFHPFLSVLECLDLRCSGEIHFGINLCSGMAPITGSQLRP